MQVRGLPLIQESTRRWSCAVRLCPVCRSAKTSAERKVLRCASRGQWADFRPEVTFAEDAMADKIDVSRMRFDETNEVSADFLGGLLAAKDDHVHPKGLRVRGARVTGTLDLEAVRDLPQLTLRGCQLDAAPVLEQAQLDWLELSCCILPALRADQLSVRYSLVLARSKIDGEVGLVQANIDGPLSLDRCRVVGGVRLAEASVAGPLSLQDALLLVGAKREESPDWAEVALSANSIRVENLASLDGLEAWGAVSLVGARIGGSLSLRRVQVHHGGRVALSADRIEVTGNTTLDGARIDGAVSLRNAQVGGRLSCNGTILDDPPRRDREGRPPPEPLHEAKVLIADQALFAGDVLLGSEAVGEDGAFRSVGCVSFMGATVNGSMVVRHASMAAIDPTSTMKSHRHIAFDAEGVQVKSRLTWRCDPPTGYVDLRYAHVHRLDDDLAAWPGDRDRRMCYLTGLVYEEVLDGFLGQDDLEKRIAWLGRQPSYTSQPYEQLARFYRNSGHLRHASDVGYEREKQRLHNLRTNYGNPPRSRKDGRKARRSWTIGSMLRWVVGFGYRPHWALGFLVGLLAFTCVLLAMAEHSGRIMPSKSSEAIDVVKAQLAARSPDSAQVAEVVAPPAGQPSEEPLPEELPDEDECKASYPCFSTWLFGLETVVPLINLRQGEYWSVHGEELNWQLLRWWLGVSSILGWVLVTLTASTVLAARR